MLRLILFGHSCHGVRHGPEKKKSERCEKARDSTFIPEPSSFVENHSKNGVPSKEVHSVGTSLNRPLAEEGQSNGIQKERLESLGESSFPSPRKSGVF